MSRWIPLHGTLAILWLLVSTLFPTLSFSGTAETLPQTSPQELAAPPVDLRWPSPLDLTLRTIDLTFRVGDITGAVQTLAVKETKTEVRIELAGDILFDFDKADLRPVAEPALQQVVEIIKQYPKAKVSIDGYTDAKGEEAYNLRLSERRAVAVKNWLVQKGGVDGKRIKTKGWGKAKPVAPNTHPDRSDNPEGRQKNRRVEVTVQK
jgi:outer membrane protein OmpA-like peptidoglycan-associated protein